MPHAVMKSGKNTESFVEITDHELEETTRAAHVEAAIEPNRSEAMPAISPTLSPTLSAIVPGFNGESSSRCSPIFPARSAPTSAALV